MGQPYTQEENERIFEMRRSGAAFKQIASELGRSEQAVRVHFINIKRKRRVKHLRKNKQGKIEKMIAAQNHEAAKSRPMFALVGERAEVAQTLRELFS